MQPAFFLSTFPEQESHSTHGSIIARMHDIVGKMTIVFHGTEFPFAGSAFRAKWK
jgi:hypothetical protein